MLWLKRCKVGGDGLVVGRGCGYSAKAGGTIA